MGMGRWMASERVSIGSSPCVIETERGCRSADDSGFNRLFAVCDRDIGEGRKPTFGGNRFNRLFAVCDRDATASPSRDPDMTRFNRLFAVCDRDEKSAT